MPHPALDDLEHDTLEQQRADRGLPSGQLPRPAKPPKGVRLPENEARLRARERQGIPEDEPWLDVHNDAIFVIHGEDV